jgi:hypothetical protein
MRTLSDAPAMIWMMWELAVASETDARRRAEVDAIVAREVLLAEQDDLVLDGVRADVRWNVWRFLPEPSVTATRDSATGQAPRVDMKRPAFRRVSNWADGSHLGLPQSTAQPSQQGLALNLMNRSFSPGRVGQT